MLAGHPPFPEGGLAERLYKHIEAEPPNLRQINPRVSEALAAVVGRMLAKKPADRPESMDVFLREFRAIKLFKEAPRTVPARKQARSE